MYQKKQHEAMRVQRGPAPRTGVLLGCEGCKRGKPDWGTISGSLE